MWEKSRVFLEVGKYRKDKQNELPTNRQLASFSLFDENAVSFRAKSRLTKREAIPFLLSREGPSFFSRFCRRY